MDKFIVRASIIVLTIYMGISFLYAWNGVLLYEYDSLYSCSLVTGILLNALVYSQGKYHCVYMRGLSSNLVLTPTLDYIDCRYCIFENAETMLIVLSSMWVISVITTLILAVRHFIRATKIKNKKHKYEHYEIRR